MILFPGEMLGLGLFYVIEGQQTIDTRIYSHNLTQRALINHLIFYCDVSSFYFEFLLMIAIDLRSRSIKTRSPHSHRSISTPISPKEEGNCYQVAMSLLIGPSLSTV